MKHNHFQRFAKPVFTCECCGRSTRLTGQSNDALCRECEELAMLQNEIFDGGSIEDIASDRDVWFKKACDLGSDPVRLKAQFPELWS